MISESSDGEVTVSDGIYGADHDAFRSAVREFLAREVWPEVDQLAQDKRIPPSIWQAAGAAGFLGLEVPEQYGGSAAGDYRFNAVLIEELAKVNMALASSLSIHFDVVTSYLLHRPVRAGPLARRAPRRRRGQGETVELTGPEHHR